MSDNKIIREQIVRISTHSTVPIQIDGQPFTANSTLPDEFTEVVFNKVDSRDSLSAGGYSNGEVQELKYTFADYIVHPYPGFDLHTKYNGGVAPPEKVMRGFTIKETEKMVMVSVHSPTSPTVRWSGWIPKKSVIIEGVQESLEKFKFNI